MQVLPTSIVPQASTTSTVSVGVVSSSSKEIASTTLSPSVTVSLSSSDQSAAIANITVPPIYSRVSVGSSTLSQFSPSRNSVDVNSNIESAGNNVVSKDGGVQTTTAQATTAQPATEVDATAGRSAQEKGDVSDESGEKPSPENEQAKEKVGVGVNEQAPTNSGALTDEQVKLVTALQSRDREVRAHEQAHKSVGGSLAGAVSFSYQTGPNGQRYAVGGEVPIDASAVSGDPAATIAKMTTVKAAATAPVDPSAQDQSVAAAASRVLSQARKDLAAENIASNRVESGDSTASSSTVRSENDGTSTSINTNVSVNFQSEYEDVIAPLETKAIQIDEMV